jgi:hypothetical protein
VIRLTDICRGVFVCAASEHVLRFCQMVGCNACHLARCDCGLVWDPDRGRHTRSGIRITEDVYSRILAREGLAIEIEEQRKAFEEADAEKREKSPMAIAMRTMFGLRFARRPR